MKEKKNVLIISQSFAPNNAISAIRFTKLVKYLSRIGKYYFWVVCNDARQNAVIDNTLESDIVSVSENVTRVYVGAKKKNNSKGNQNSKSEKPSLYFRIKEELIDNKQRTVLGFFKRLLGYLLVLINDIKELAEEVRFSQLAMVEIKETVPIEDIDIMISTYGNVGSVLVANKIKCGISKIKWIVDYRDPIRGETGIKRKILKAICASAEKKAEHVVGVTASCIGADTCKDKFTVISNGFDTEDLEKINYIETADYLSFAYTGKIYYGKSDASLLFSILSELYNENKIDLAKIRFEYAGPHYFEICKQAKQYGIERILCNRGSVSRKEALEIQKSADILCALTWNNAESEAILTGKVLEYFMMKKPIFAVVSGNKPNSMLKNIIENAKIGYCLEECQRTLCYEPAKEWILDQYQRHVTGKELHYEGNYEYLEQYTYQYQTEKYKNLIESIL